jgi:DNA-binding HxlR family transcriptional regulator
MMTPFRNTIVLALQLAKRRRGVVAAELAEAAACSSNFAARTLRDLAADGVLERTVPARKGKRRGDWRIIYRPARSR